MDTLYNLNKFSKEDYAKQNNQPTLLGDEDTLLEILSSLIPVQGTLPPKWGKSHEEALATRKGDDNFGLLPELWFDRFPPPKKSLPTESVVPLFGMSV